MYLDINIIETYKRRYWRWKWQWQL